MLVEVQCDKFMRDGQIREPIQFHKGLNAVLGDDNGSNSIGKSTFLMILDFVFGGTDYVKKCTDVHENVGRMRSTSRSSSMGFLTAFRGARSTTTRS